MEMKDPDGKMLTVDMLEVAKSKGAGWVDYYWYKPGENTPARKVSYVRKVVSGRDTFIVGSGLYLDEQ